MLPNSSIQPVADAILRFLTHQPNGADTAENIERWWLSQHSAEAAIESVHEAMNLLERAGEVEKASMEGGQMLYQRVAD